MWKIRNIALLFVFCLLGLSSYAQTETTKDIVGSWSNNATWNDGTAPAANYDNISIDIYGTITYTGDIYFGNFQTLTINDTLIVTGNMTFNMGHVVIGSGGLLVVKGNLIENTSNGSYTIASGGRLVVFGSASIDCEMTINGEFNVSGGLSYGGSNTFTNNGNVIVGGNLNFTSGGNVYLNAGSYIGVLGDATITSTNVDPACTGEIAVVGTSTCADCSGAAGLKQDTKIDPSDPIMSVTLGMDVIAFLTDANIGETPYTNAGSGTYSGIIWTSDNYNTGCYLNVIASGDILFSDGASAGQAYFEYSTDGGYNWTTGPTAVPFYNGNLYRKDGINVSTHMIMMRLVANGLASGGTVTVDNITIAATNEGGSGTIPIDWASQPRDVCSGEPAVYEISNFADYSDIQWTAASGVTILSVSPNKAVCTVRWDNSPGQLNVTVVGGTCGGASSSVTYPITVSQPVAFHAFYTKTDITCNNTTPANGSISIGYCGGSGAVTYDWYQGPYIDHTGPATLSNLEAGTYKVQVKRGTDSEILTIDIVRPDAVVAGLANVNAFLCPSAPNSGAFDVVPSGGTAPYTVTVLRNGVNITTPSLSYTGLDAATYTINIVDANGCTGTNSVTIVTDNTAPTFTDFPDDEHMTIADYLAAVGSMSSSTALPGVTLNTSTSEIPAIPDVSAMHNLTLSFNVAQAPVSSNNADVFTVEVNYGSGWTTLLSDNNALDAASLSFPLGPDADNNPSLQIRYSATIATSGLVYTVSGASIKGVKFPATVGGGDMIGCDDNSGVCSTPTYTDAPPVWIGTCKSYTDGEFYVTRTWYTADACQTATRTQRIAVGTAPYFQAGTFPANATFDFCHNTPASVTAPTPVDACGTATVSWVVTNSASGDIVNNGLATGTGNLAGVTFPYPPTGVADSVYHVTWTVTDEAGFTLSQVQTITVKPAMVITLIPFSGDEDFCTGEEVQFNVSVTGGTGAYGVPTFTPASSVAWNSSNGNISGTYTTTGLVWNGGAGTDIVVTYTDADNGGVTGGCTTAPTFRNSTDGFRVHPNITTNAITRD